MRTIRTLISLFALALLIIPAQLHAQGVTQVSGHVLYRERIALPSTARMILQLQDVSRADAPAGMIAEQTIDLGGKTPPFEFALSYDPQKIDVRFTYALRAEIRDGNRLLFTTADSYHVITQGNPSSSIEIVLVSAGGQSAPTLPQSLLERDWSLIGITHNPTETALAIKDKRSIRFSADGHITGSGGCNIFSGNYMVGEQQQLRFSQLISTLIACDPAISSQEQEYVAALQSVSSYSTGDDYSHMQLHFDNGQGTLFYQLVSENQRCFSQTNHCLSGRFFSYWQQNGGEAVFGFPISDQMVETNLTTQYFERQRFELHTENTAPYDVLIGRLGDEVLLKQNVSWFNFPTVDSAQSGCLYFAETKHSLCNMANGPSFLNYWRSHGLEFDSRNGSSYAESLALFGMPISEPFEAVVENQIIQVQWFERARFEWHPENPSATRVLLGRLGAELRDTSSPAGLPAYPLSSKVVILNNSNNGQAVQLAVGQVLEVRLNSNPSTGFSWEVSQSDPGILQVVGQPTFEPSNSGAVGAGGVQVFRFEVAAIGQSTLTLVYRRPFEEGVAPVNTFSVPITVS